MFHIWCQFVAVANELHIDFSAQLCCNVICHSSSVDSSVIVTKPISNHVTCLNCFGFLMSQDPHKQSGSHASTPRDVGWQIAANKIVQISRHQRTGCWRRDSLGNSCRKSTVEIDEHRMTNAKGRNSVPKNRELFSIASVSPDAKPASKLLVQFVMP